MNACPYCKGTTGYRNRVMVEYERQRHWDDKGEGHLETGTVLKEHRRRFCMDCGRCVSMLLDMPTFKL